MKVCMGVGPDGNGSLAKQNGHPRYRPAPVMCALLHRHLELLQLFIDKSLRDAEAAVKSGIPMGEIRNEVWRAIIDIFAQALHIMRFKEEDWSGIPRHLQGAWMAHIADLDEEFLNEMLAVRRELVPFRYEAQKMCGG